MEIFVLADKERDRGLAAQPFTLDANADVTLLFDAALGRYSIDVVPGDERQTVFPLRGVDLGRHARLLNGRPLILKGEIAEVISPFSGRPENLRTKMWWEGYKLRPRRPAILIEGGIVDSAFDQRGNQILFDRSCLPKSPK